MPVPLPPLPMNYWGMFPTQTNFLKQYAYADLEKELLFCKLVYEANFLPIIDLMSQK